MNTFTITFKNALGEFKTEEITLDFVTVQGVIAWFEENYWFKSKINI